MYPLVRISTESVTRQLTPTLWRGVLNAYADADPTLGAFYFEDFKDPIANSTDASASEGWFIQDAAAGGTSESLAAPSGDVDGKAVLGATTGTDHFGIEMHRGASATTGGNTVQLPTHADGRGVVVYETYLDFATASDNWFAGLTEAIVEFLSATGTLPTSSDYIGFYQADDGALKFVCANDNNGGTAVTDEVTLYEAADVPTGLTKLGFRVNTDNTVEIFVDEVQIKVDPATDTVIEIDPDALPIEDLVCKFATTRGATDDLATVALTIDWVGTFVGN